MFLGHDSAICMRSNCLFFKGVIIDMLLIKCGVESVSMFEETFNK
jgi:hypothetical protein